MRKLPSLHGRRPWRPAGAGLALICLLSAGVGHTDELRVDPAAPASEGYKGVAPGGPGLPPNPPKLPIKNGPQRLTWSGFQVKDGVPTVFVQVTAPPDYQIAEQKGALVVTLKNTVVHLKNNRRPLRVGAFETAVKDVTTRAKGRDTQVVIATKDAGVPAHRERVEAAAGGFQMLVIELPPASK
jgi:hypothetical protein